MTDSVAITPLVNSALSLAEGPFASGSAPRAVGNPANETGSARSNTLARSALAGTEPLATPTGPIDFQSVLSERLNSAPNATGPQQSTELDQMQKPLADEFLPDGAGVFGMPLPVGGNILPATMFDTAHAAGLAIGLGPSASAVLQPTGLLPGSAITAGEGAGNLGSASATADSGGTLQQQTNAGEIAGSNLLASLNNLKGGADPMPGSTLPVTNVSMDGVASADIPLHSSALLNAQAQLTRAQKSQPGLAESTPSEYAAKLELRRDSQLAAQQDQLLLGRAQQFAQLEYVDGASPDAAEMVARFTESDATRSYQRLNWSPLTLDAPAAAAPNQLAATLLPMSPAGEGLSPANLMLSAEPRQAQEQLAQGFAQLVRKGEQTLDIQLTPANLGKIQARIVMQGDQAQLWLIVPNAEVRELFEQSMPRLADLLKDAGLTLGDASIANADEQSYQQLGDGDNTAAGWAEESETHAAEPNALAETRPADNNVVVDPLLAARGYAAAGLTGTGSIDAYA